MKGQAWRSRISLVLIALLLGTGLAFTAPRSTAAAEVCFQQTNQCLEGVFLDYWQNRGGLELLGYPISPKMNEVNPTDQKVYLVQYTERTRLEYHPELANTPYVVLAGLLGREQMLSKYPNGTPSGTSAPGGLYFPQTNKSLSPDFAEWWTNHGGLELVGYPLSDEFVEVNPSDNKPYVVQYTERTRLERHPENAPPYNVLAGLLGREQYLAKYPAWGPTLAPLAGGKPYIHPSGFFTFSVPQNWQPAANPASFLVLFIAPGNVASVGIQAEGVPNGFTLDDLDQTYAKLLQQGVPDYALVSLDKVTVNGLKAYRRIYKGTLNNVPIQVEMVYMLGSGDKIAYVVQAGTTVAGFPSLQPTFDAIAGTFQVLK